MDLCVVYTGITTVATALLLFEATVSILLGSFLLPGFFALRTKTHWMCFVFHITLETVDAPEKLKVGQLTFSFILMLADFH